ncbi:putative polyketide synthase [Lophium mytilinum]|uniref:Putative polyketide synthase n=1 Tax=Lophium mytilinum TaxID=390894 RepID=A0A6A6R469_9PEZI|nr:putative polyketide synthase [Lophium mytilinum]
MAQRFLGFGTISTLQDTQWKTAIDASARDCLVEAGRRSHEEIQDAIAITGFSIDFPQASTADEFWELLAKGRSVARPFPSERSNHGAWHNAAEGSQGSIRPERSYFLDRDIGAFDAPFFSITEAEAGAMDPQQRGLLETTYRALEDAGIPISAISGTDASVFTGCFTADYLLLAAKDPERLPKYFATGSAGSMLSNRISTFFNLTGPSMTIDTACSSSLVALDMACESLRRGNSSLGIVTGCNLIYSLDFTIGLSNMGFLSPEGICHSFDQRANGYARGEGFGSLIIKPLSSALRDGDTIRAVVRATGSNQNGYTTLAHPSKDAQIRLIQDTYRRARLDMSVTQFIEAHGTGTSAGDPIEAAAIGEAFRSSSRKSPLLVGASKANIGHLEGTSGIAGVVKTILVLERGIVPPIADLDQLNPAIDAEFWNLTFPTTCVPWPTEGLRRASVNSFGFGGSNAHAVLDDAYNFLAQNGLQGNHSTSISPPGDVDMYSSSQLPSMVSTSRKMSADHPQLFVWSAADEKVLSRLLELYHSHLESKTTSHALKEIYSQSLATTLSERRSVLPWKSFIVANNMDALIKATETVPLPVRAKPNAQLGFVFTGQGAQWINMGTELLLYPIFRQRLMQAEQYLQTLGCSWQISDFIGNHEPSAAGDIHDAQFSQPLCTILQMALVDLLQTFNITPSIVLGHSSGEIAAAYAAGVISRESGWKLAYYRGILSSDLSKKSSVSGAMMSVALNHEVATSYMKTIAPSTGSKFLCVACINSPSNITISGDTSSIQRLKVYLDEEGVFNRVLAVPVAYHSPQMEGISLAYERAITPLEGGKKDDRGPPMISTVTGKSISPAELLRPSYWIRNMVSPVRFADAIETCCIPTVGRTTKKIDLSHRNAVCATDLLEIGPHSALQVPIREILTGVPGGKSVTYASLLVRHKHAVSTLMNALGELYCLGYPVEITQLNASGDKCQRKGVALPGLPQYPFDHSKTYWTESRISKNLRFRAHGPYSLIGAPVMDWSPLEPRWRNFLSASPTSTCAWVRDHKINGTILLPAAGMMVMAIEAVTQILESGPVPIVAYEIRNATFLSALAVPLEEEGIETHIYLRHAADSLHPGFEFSICTHGDSSTLEICRGLIHAIFEDRNSASVEEAREIAEAARMISTKVEDFLRQAPKEDTGQRLYSRLYKLGYHFGESFRRIEHIHYDDGNEAVGQVSAFQDRSTTTAVIHPATLDGILQMMLPAATLGGNRDISTTVPTRIDRLRILKTDRLHNASHSSPLQAHVSLLRINSRTTSSGINAYDPESGTLVVTADGVEATAVTDFDFDHAEQKKPRRLCFDLKLRPDISLLSKTALEQFLLEARPTCPDPTEYWGDIMTFISVIMRKASQEVSLSDVPSQPPHLRKHFAWIIEHPASKMESDVALDELHVRLRNHGRLGEIYSNFGQYLNPILKGERDALEILSGDNVFRDYYDVTRDSWKFMAPMKTYIELLSHKNPALKILEVGAGTGSTTKHILEALAASTSHGISARFSQFDFTDISHSFLAKAEDEFSEYPKMRYGILNVEEDPSAQGYQAESYDLVIAANVLHATKSLDVTLSSLRKVLKKNGKLVLIEITEPEFIGAPIIFGCLSGWWESTDSYRTQSPLISAEQWDEVLKRNGFSGVDVLSRDHNNSYHNVSLMISTAIDSTAPIDAATTAEFTPITEVESARRLEPHPIIAVDNHFIRIIAGFETSSDNGLAQTVRKQVGNSQVVIESFQGAANASDLSDCLVIVAYETPWPQLDQLSEDQFCHFQTVFTTAKALLWISETTTSDSDCPQHAMITGFARTLRTERTGLIFTHLILSGASDDSRRRHISQALENTLIGIKTGVYEPELSVSDDLLIIPRIYEDDDLDQTVYSMTVPQPQETQWGHRDLTLQIKSPGLLDSLYFAELAQDDSFLAPDELEVEVRATGVNFKDVLVAMGHVNDSTFGTECSGVVLRAGSQCNSKPGDRVVACHLDAFRRTIRCRDFAVALIPENLSFAEAASIPTNFITAYRALFDTARLQPGETVLIHAGAGGTGQAAVQVAQYFGAIVYTTVSSESKKQLLMQLYQVPEESILYSRDLSFAKAIQRLTKGKGVDVVLNSLSGASLLASWECVAPYGRFIEIGKRDILDRRNLPLAQFERNVTFSAIDIAAMATERPDLVSRSLANVLRLFENGALKVVRPFETFPIARVEEAFRYLQTGKNSGKVVVEMMPSAHVPALIPARTTWTLKAESTYVIAGGLGGQGRSIAKWLVSRGARHLLLLSRRGASGTVATKFVEEMKGMGVEVSAPPCDITDRNTLSEVLGCCAQSMPPIKGCFQASAVFRDTYFDKMTCNEWNEALVPKVTGSWNLHTLLPRDMDFFVFLSSLTGIIGSQVQSSYAAGNTFEDALAQYRVSIGQKATSIDLSAMQSEGVLADHREVFEQIVNVKQLLPMSQEELFAILGQYCQPTVTRAQVITGLELPASVAAKGAQEPTWMSQPMFSILHQVSATTASANTADSTAAQDTNALLQSAESPEQLTSVLLTALKQKLSKFLSIVTESFDVDKPLHSYGVDSLIAMELRNWFLKVLKVEVSVFELLGGSSTRGLAATFAQRMGLEPGGGGADA